MPFTWTKRRKPEDIPIALDVVPEVFFEAYERPKGPSWTVKVESPCDASLPPSLSLSLFLSVSISLPLDLYLY